MKLASGNIKEDGLLSIPAQVGAKEKGQPNRHTYPLDAAKKTGHPLGVDGLATGINVPVFCLVIKLFQGFQVDLSGWFVHVLAYSSIRCDVEKAGCVELRMIEISSVTQCSIFRMGVIDEVTNTYGQNDNNHDGDTYREN